VHRFAQTNLQLMNQMRGNSYTTSEIGLAVRSYDLAVRLFTGLYRASGKTFLAHLVGTGSILADLQAPAPLLAAALIHAAYEIGDFGDGAHGISPQRRDLIRSAIGDEIERYVAAYSSLRWNEHTMRELHGKLDSLSSLERNVLLIRLANEVEDYLDLGILYCGEEKRRQTNYLNDNGRILTEMAEGLGFAPLAAEMNAVFQEVVEAQISPDPTLTGVRDGSFLVAPQSYQRLMDAMAKRLKPTQPAG
jgi:(p)ppGpp synthase/HD superfamily hydrolase